MKFTVYTQVRLKNGIIPGVVLGSVEAIEKYGVQPAYEVQWLDGNIQVHLECELRHQGAVNDPVY